MLSCNKSLCCQADSQQSVPDTIVRHNVRKRNKRYVVKRNARARCRWAIRDRR